MHKSALCLVFGLSLAAAASGCKNEEACTKARLATANAWQGVKNEATHFKFQGAAGYDDFSAAQKATHLETWKTIEEQSELVFESFAFEKIGWGTADKAHVRVVKEFDGYFAKDKYSGFKGLLGAAEKRYTEAEAACR